MTAVAVLCEGIKMPEIFSSLSPWLNGTVTPSWKFGTANVLKDFEVSKKIIKIIKNNHEYVLHIQILFVNL